MAVKQYKVVCSRPRFSGKMFIDIAPADGIIHDQILFSRSVLNKQTDPQPVDNLYGSIYLRDNGSEVTVEFPPVHIRKNTPDYEGTVNRYRKLEPEIIKRYKQMRAEGRESTIHIYGISEMCAMSEDDEYSEMAGGIVTKETSTVPASYAQKHLSPKSPQEERQQQFKEQVSAKKRPAYSPVDDTVPAWLRFQRQYSGD